MQLELQFGPVRNNNSFSNHWLENRLPLEPEWQDYRRDAEKLLDKCSVLWEQEKDHLERYSEGGLEQAFIQPILSMLG